MIKGTKQVIIQILSSFISKSEKHKNMAIRPLGANRTAGVRLCKEAVSWEWGRL